MTDDHRAPYVKPSEGFLQQGGLRVGRPDPAARTIAEAKTGTVEGDNPVLFAEQIEDPAQHEIARHCAVAVQQHDTGTSPALDVVETDTVDGDELAPRGIFPFSPARQGIIDDAQRRQCGGAGAENSS